MGESRPPGCLPRVSAYRRQRRELTTARGTRGRGCLVTGISHSSSSIVHTVTGRKELDWTSPDWNKPLLPSPLFTTPTSPPAPLPPTFIQGRIVGKCSIFRDENPAAREGRRSGAGLPPTHSHTRDPIAHLTRW